MEQFRMNQSVLSETDIHKIKSISITIVGLGGLGGFVITSLVRLGFQIFQVFEEDTFDESNLNRQLYANRATIGIDKTKVTIEELKKINPDIQITIQKKFNNQSIINGDVVFGCLDNISDRLTLEELSVLNGKTLVHGATYKWYGEVGIIKTNNILKKRYQDSSNGLKETPTFTVPIIANLMVSEYIKHLQGSNVLVDHLLLVDLLELTFDMI